MIKRLLNYAWSLRQQFIRYFITGVSGVVIDIASLYLLKEYLQLRPVTAVIINQLFLINYIFVLNKYWSFKAQGMMRTQIIRFYMLACANYLFSIGWMWLWNDRFGFNYLLVRVFNIALAVGWNFLLYKYWVYRENQISLPPS